MRTFWISFTTLVGCFALVCRADEPTAGARDDTLAENRMAVMRSRIMALSVDGEPGEKHFGTEAILRYSDPTRQITDASVWRLGQSGRPRAVLVLEVYRGTRIQMEPTALVNPPKQLKGKSWQWNPKAAPFDWKPIPTEVSVAGSAEQMQRQIRQLSRKFAAAESFRGQSYQLRLMPKPLLRYADDRNGVLAGVVFAWVHGTNVETLMSIEVQKSLSGATACVAGFSRLGAASFDLKFDGQPFWDAPAVSSTSSTNAYYFRMMGMTPEERRAFSH